MDPIARRAAQRAAKALNLAAAQPPAPSLLTAGRESEAPAVSGDAALQPARGQLGSEMVSLHLTILTSPWLILNLVY